MATAEDVAAKAQYNRACNVLQMLTMDELRVLAGFDGYRRELILEIVGLFTPKRRPTTWKQLAAREKYGDTEYGTEAGGGDEYDRATAGGRGGGRGGEAEGRAEGEVGG